MHKNKILIISLTLGIAVILGTWIFRITTSLPVYVDVWTRGMVEQVADTRIYTFFRWMTELGSGTFLTPFTLIMAVVLGLLFRNWLGAMVFAAGTLSAHGLNVFIKVLVQRERPSILLAAEAQGYSFPSGHAMISMVCYGLLAYVIARNIRNASIKIIVQLFFSVLIFLIGISRYVINVHYLTDVLAGFVFGVIWLLIAIYVYELLGKRHSS